MAGRFAQPSRLYRAIAFDSCLTSRLILGQHRALENDCVVQSDTGRGSSSRRPEARCVLLAHGSALGYKQRRMVGP
jgi:hypothetical protein